MLRYRSRLAVYLRHLRLGFNLLLSPIFLWGLLLAGGGLQAGRAWLAFLALHIFLYGGTTAFNSYYDRDEGPVGGMLHPPAFDGGLLPFSLAVQALGLPLALAVGPAFTLVWLALFAVFTAYSHPAIRLKARTAAALTAIALGQGALGFSAGWLVSGRPQGLLSLAGLVGMLCTALIVFGIYIVTQSYQTAEDRTRGDRTLPVLLGPSRALLVALLALAVGGGLLVGWVALRIDPRWAVLLALLFGLLGAWLVRWALSFDEGRVEHNFRTAMRFVSAASAALTFFLLVQLLA